MNTVLTTGGIFENPGMLNPSSYIVKQLRKPLSESIGRTTEKIRVRREVQREIYYLTRLKNAVMVGREYESNRDISGGRNSYRMGGVSVKHTKG